MKLALITDQHIGARNSNSIFLDYYSKFYSKLFFPYLIENGIDTILNGGDTLDNRKTTNVLTMDRFHEMWINPILKNKMTEHVILGNHTAYYKNTNSVNSLSPFYGKGNGLNLYQSTPEELELGGILWGMVPWITNDNSEECFDFLKTTKAEIILGHFEITGFAMDGGIKCENGISIGEFKRFKKVFSGHFHKKQTVANISYLGSPYDMTYADLGEQKGFHTFDTDTWDLNFVPNPDKKFFRLIYDDKENEYEFTDDEFSDMKDCFVRVVVQNKTKTMLYESLLEHLERAGLYKVSIMDTTDVNGETATSDIDMSMSTIEIVNTYIEKIQDIQDRNMLKDIMAKLYTEAINL